MKRFILLISVCLACGITVNATVPSFVNPVLPFDYSDPDVCRIGDTYLMTSSSFNNVPGLQILASKDLVHWEIVDAAIRYRLPGYEQGFPLPGHYVWAPAIRMHDQRVYIYYGDPDRGIYCIRSKQLQPSDINMQFPLEWEEPVLVMEGKGIIDPCPLWDEDGRVWLAHAYAGSRARFKSVLSIAELSADGLSVKVPSRVVFDGHEEHATCEGPKLYKRNGWYYLMHPAGGVKEGWQVVQRSKNIYGPYELKITLAQRRTDINGPHQGAWVDTPDNEDWFIHFQDKGVAGRIIHMQPVHWQDDWPVMGNNGEPIFKYQGIKDNGTKDGKPTYANFFRRDDFDGLELALDWQWSGGYVSPKWYFCDAAHSLVRLYSAECEQDGYIPNLLLQKIPDVAFTATARVRFMPNSHPEMKEAEHAGMIVFGRQSFRLEVPVTGEWCYLRLQMTDKQIGQFYTSQDGQQWTPYGKPFQAVEGVWTGAQIGLYCTRDHRIFNDAGWMDVDYFELQMDN